jgi:DNA-binding FrmR family transcriptional regulator
MSDAERTALLALLARIEGKVDSVLKQLDGLLEVCERLEGDMAAAGTFEAALSGGRTLH